MYAKRSSEPAHRFVGELARLYEERGARWYGSEPVTQLEHALQCAALAEADGASCELVVASLLHDVGHLAPEADETGSADDLHEYRAFHTLRRYFGAPVLEPIRMHVTAKRYLCAVLPGYSETLTPASRRSLELQGGTCTLDEARTFIEVAYACDAVQLRLWNDRAKVPGKRTPGFEHYADLLLRCAL